MIIAAVAVSIIAATAPAREQAPVFLDVPYIQQSEALCGGAAAAMVMRYWGAVDVYAESFSMLVDRSAGGIRADALISHLQQRGWSTHSFRGDGPLVRSRLQDGQPVITLIEDRPGIFHYVVILAWTNGRVVVHDPARAPFRVIDENTFDRAWQQSQRWTLVALPRETLKSADTAETGSPVLRPMSLCSPIVESGVRIAGEGRLSDALQVFQGAANLCQADAAPWREMAGVYAIEKDWTNAASHARAALDRDRSDELAWRILAASSFVTGDKTAALNAWNQIGEPRIDLVNVGGLERTRHSAATGAMGVNTRTVLTWDALVAANRRLDELPAAQSARVTYRPLEDGRAAVDAIVMERPYSPVSLPGLAVVGAKALSDLELRGWMSNPTGAGDLLIGSWRWWENRPRIGVSYASATRGGRLEAEGFWERETYRMSTSEAADAVETRKRASLTLSNWTTRNLRWQIGAALDGWSDRGHSASLAAAVDKRAAADRLSLRTGVSLFAGAFTAWTLSADAEWRSSPHNQGLVLLAGAGTQVASSAAPLALWSGAGTGHGRDLLLRGHALLDDGVIVGDVFGRRVYHGGVEWRRWFKPGLRILPIAPAVFVDVARAEHRLRPGDARHADAGAGVRIAVPGTGVLRVDIAKGLRDGATAFSMGWTR